MDTKTRIGIGAALAGAFALGVTVISLSGAQPSASSSGASEENAAGVETSFSTEQEDDIRALVQDYLMTNPEIIIQAVNEYSRRERLNAEIMAREGAKEFLPALLDPKHGYVAGRDPENAKVAVIELFDYHCGFCKRAVPLVKDLTKDEKDIQFVFREFPILKKESDYAAEMALAAREQGKFLDMHFAMMESSGTLTKDRIKDIAKKQGVDFNALEAARQSPDVPAAINETVSIARAMGVEGTPAFIIASTNGEYINVVQGFDPESLLQSIDEARAAAG